MPPLTDAEYAALQPNNRDPEYGPGFFKFADMDHGWSNHLFGHILYLLFKPKSAIDFGCGTAGTLSALRSHGVEVQGLDGSAHCVPFIERTDPAIAKTFIVHDLGKPWTPPRTYDLAVSIEVLEHIAPEGADTMVKSIASSAPLAVVTACPPTGRNHLLHLNEQPFVYWIEKFAKAGMEVDVDATHVVQAVMRPFYDFQVAGRYPIVPTWFFSSCIAAFRRKG